MSLIDGLRDLVASARDAAGRLHSENKRINSAIETLRTEEGEVFGAPIPPEELRRKVGDEVRVRAGQWMLSAGELCRVAFSGRVGEDGSIRPGGWPDAVGLRLSGLEPLSFGLLCAFDPDRMTKAILEAIDCVHPNRAPGLPLRERPARLAEIRQAIAELQREHDVLVQAAAEADVMIRPLPENRAKALAAERQAEAHGAYLRANAGAIRRAEAEERVREEARAHAQEAQRQREEQPTS